MNEFQKQSISACKATWETRFQGHELEFIEKNTKSIGPYYVASGELATGMVNLVIYEDEAGVSYTDNELTWWKKFIYGGWGLPSYMFEKPDYDSTDALGKAFIEKFSSLIANPPKLAK